MVKYNYVVMIPARGGSKSIPLKNIKEIAGQPLIYWTLDAAVNSKYVDKVFVSTDSEEIKNIVEAYNKKLVKKIAVKAVTLQGDTGNCYLYLHSINLSKNYAPTATIEIESIEKNGVKKKLQTFSEGDDLYVYSNNKDDYKNCRILNINPKTDTVTFSKIIDGRDKTQLKVGEVVGAINDDLVRRIQIRETILSHFARERKLFKKGIKVLSLFFIG